MKCWVAGNKPMNGGPDKLMSSELKAWKHIEAAPGSFSAVKICDYRMLQRR